MSLSISEYPISQSIARPVQTLQNSNVYQTNINYGATERFINNTELSQSINLLNNGEITSPTEDINLNYVSNTDNINLGTNQINSEINYYNQSINNYETGEVTSSQNQINNTYATPTLSQIKVLPTKYLPVKVIQSVRHQTVHITQQPVNVRVVLQDSVVMVLVQMLYVSVH